MQQQQKVQVLEQQRVQQQSVQVLEQQKVQQQQDLVQLLALSLQLHGGPGPAPGPPRPVPAPPRFVPLGCVVVATGFHVPVPRPAPSATPGPTSSGTPGGPTPIARADDDPAAWWGDAWVCRDDNGDGAHVVI